METTGTLENPVHVWGGLGRFRRTLVLGGEQQPETCQCPSSSFDLRGQRRKEGGRKRRKGGRKQGGRKGGREGGQLEGEGLERWWESRRRTWRGRGGVTASEDMDF